MVELLPSMSETMGSIPSTEEKMVLSHNEAERDCASEGRNIAI